VADPLYDQLVLLDGGVAEAYKKATHGHRNAIIGPESARLIFAAVIADGITESEADALVWLMLKANITEDALKTIFAELHKSVDDDAFFRGGAKALCQNNLSAGGIIKPTSIVSRSLVLVKLF
jgi:hypothetical protein